MEDEGVGETVNVKETERFSQSSISQREFIRDPLALKEIRLSINVSASQISLFA